MGVSLFALAAIVGTVGFTQAADLNGEPTASVCVDDWNDHAGAGSRATIARNGYRSAAVHGWYHDFAGCAIVFRPPGAHPFLVHVCTRSFSASDPAGTDWGCELDVLAWDASGSADPLTAAAVTRGGKLILES